jgi:hypothetical protein
MIDALNYDGEYIVMIAFSRSAFAARYYNTPLPDCNKKSQRKVRNPRI